jgi:hypothetical protein
MWCSTVFTTEETWPIEDDPARTERRVMVMGELFVAVLDDGDQELVREVREHTLRGVPHWLCVVAEMFFQLPMYTPVDIKGEVDMYRQPSGPQSAAAGTSAWAAPLGGIPSPDVNQAVLEAFSSYMRDAVSLYQEDWLAD